MRRFVYVRQSAAILFVVGTLVVGGALGLEITSWAGHPFGSGRSVPVYLHQATPIPAADVNSMGFAPLFKPALPAVVSIATSREVNLPQSPLFNNPFFQQFFGGSGQHQQKQREMGLGSGVIVSSDGYILTNNHVIEKATDIKVMLPDKRQFPGKVVGADPQSDIAVVKIAAKGLPTVTLGDSSKLQVGDYAFAIGNPFAIGETATMGIISATGRNGLDIEDYEDFIQTDAAINPGNSGGALLDARGALIGINTAILSRGTGGFEGVGFAIPINMAKYVMDQIIKNGKVVRGFIGVSIQEVTPSLAKAFNVPAESGALIGNVEPNSPGANAGLQRGDVITQLNGQPVKGPNELRLDVAKMAPGTVVRANVLRNGQTHEVTIKLGEAPTQKPASEPSASSDNTPLLGIQVTSLTDSIRQHLGLGSSVKGVVITAVAEGSPAAEAGLQTGDVIEQVNRHPITSPAEFRQLVEKAGKQSIVLLVDRQGGTSFVVVQPQG